VILLRARYKYNNNAKLFCLSVYLLHRQQGNIRQRHLGGTSVTYEGRNSPNTGTSKMNISFQHKKDAL